MGCYFRRLKNLEISLDYLEKALRINMSNNKEYLGLTHLNLFAVLY